MLKKISIKGYKSIRDVDLELNPINLLIGANGVGKSNFISFFKLVNNIYEEKLQEFSLKSGVENLLHYGRKNTTELSGFLKFHTSNSLRFTLKVSEEGNLFIGEQGSGYQGNENVYNNIKESNIKESNTFRDVHLRKFLQSCKIYHFHDTSTSSSMRTPSQVDDNRVLRENGSNLPSYLYYLQQKHNSDFLRIEKIIASVVPNFDKFNLSPSSLDETKIKLEWFEKEHGDTYFDATHLSDGSLRFIALTVLLQQPNLPETIIIDEPELGLHPVSINKLAGLIKSASERGCQIIISTQSVNLLNNFSSEDIITVDRENGQSTFSRLDGEQIKNWLEDYSLGELWTKSIIKGQPL